MKRKTKIELSPNFNEIVDLLISGYSGRYVSNYLKETYNETIGYKALNNYKKNNLNVKARLRENIIKNEKELNKRVETGINKQLDKEAKANESIEAAVNYLEKDIKKLDNIITEAENIKINIDDYNPTNVKNFKPDKKIELQLKYIKIGLQAIKLKYSILEDKELDINVNEEPLFDEEYFNRILEEENEL